MKKKLGEKGSSKELSTSIGNTLALNSRGLGFKLQISVGDKNFPLSFLSCYLKIAVYL